MIDNESLKLTIKNNRLFRTLYKVVCDPALAGRFHRAIGIRINLIKTNTCKDVAFKFYDSGKFVFKEENEKIIRLTLNKLNTTIVSELYTLLVGNKRLAKYDSSRSNYGYFVTKLLRDTIMNEVNRDKVTKNLFAYELDSLDPFDMFHGNEFNKDINNRVAQKVKPNLLVIENLSAPNVLEHKINTKEIIELFKEFYGDELINLILKSSNLKNVENLVDGFVYRTPASLIKVAKELCLNYNTLNNRLKRSKTSFKRFLLMKGLKYEDII